MIGDRWFLHLVDTGVPSCPYPGVLVQTGVALHSDDTVVGNYTSSTPLVPRDLVKAKLGLNLISYWNPQWALRFSSFSNLPTILAISPANWASLSSRLFSLRRLIRTVSLYDVEDTLTRVTVVRIASGVMAKTQRAPKALTLQARVPSWNSFVVGSFSNPFTWNLLFVTYLVRLQLFPFWAHFFLFLDWFFSFGSFSVFFGVHFCNFATNLVCSQLFLQVVHRPLQLT